MKKEKLIPVTAMVTRETKEELAALVAGRPRMSISYIIDLAIQQYLRSEKKEPPAHEGQVMVGA